MQTDAEVAEDLYASGLLHFYQGEADVAFEYYSNALQLNPLHVGALFELSRLNVRLREYDKALELCSKAASLDPENRWIRQELVQLYMQQDRVDEAVAELETMSQRFADPRDILSMLCDIYRMRSDFSNEVRTLNRLETLLGHNDALTMRKSEAYSRLGDEKNALACLRQMSEENPNDMLYKVLIANHYAEIGKRKEALKAYREIERIDPDNVYLLTALSDYYRTEGDTAAYRRATERALLNRDLAQEDRLQTLRMLAVENLQQQGDTAAMLDLFHRVLEMPQEDNSITALCASYMVGRGLSRETLKPVLWQMLDIDPENDDARQQLLGYAAEEEDTTTIVSLCSTAVNYNSNQLVYYYYLALVKYLNEDYATALDVCKSGLARKDADSNVHASTIGRVYNLAGDICHSLDLQHESYEFYDSCLLYTPDQTLVLNNYAYYLSLEGRDLEHAERMASRANALMPDNPTYMDTYAWVLFMQKRYAEARVIMDKVLILLGDSIESEDATLVEHAGDVYSRLGQTDRAVELWKQALELGADTPSLPEKIRRRKYIAE